MGLVAAITLSVYAPTLHYPFISYDDPVYIIDNPHVVNGLSWDGIKWAFRSTVSLHYHPVTWISHMVDVEFFGMEPGAHHASAIIIHALATILLFTVIHRWTRHVWSAAFVAILFGIHPLHVESVAWLSERKDVLAGFFLALVLLAYGEYSRRPSVFRYLTVVLFFVCGLLSKATLVVLPAALLLLDYWPLGRFQHTKTNLQPGLAPPIKMRTVSYIRAVLEKTPLGILSVLLALGTLYLQGAGSNMVQLGAMPWTFRLSNAALSATTYMGKTFWPSGLAFFYPMHPIPSLDAVMSALLILSLSIGAVFQVRKRPYLFVGWFWFLFFLLPVIGIAQVGIQARADRYAYLPLIGLGLGMAGTIREMAAEKNSRYKGLVLTLTALFLLGITGVAVRQVGFWRSNLDLFQRAVDVTENNFIAHNNLGDEYFARRQFKEAEAHFRQATEIMPLEPHLFVNLGNVLLIQKRHADAISAFEQALSIKDDYKSALVGLARAYILSDRFEDGLAFYRKASGSLPGSADSHRFAGNAYLGQGRLDEAATHFERAANMNPQNPELWFRLGLTYTAQGRQAEAVKCFERALALNPGYELARKALQYSHSKLGETNPLP